MADDVKEGEVIPPRGADWEVVSLTASTYAATPDPKGFDPNDDDSGSGQESSSEMFMSDHFVFPPSEHENLPIEPDSSEIHYISEDKTVISAVDGEEERRDKLDDDPQGTEIFEMEAPFLLVGWNLRRARACKECTQFLILKALRLQIPVILLIRILVLLIRIQSQVMEIIMKELVTLVQLGGRRMHHLYITTQKKQTHFGLFSWLLL